METKPVEQRTIEPASLIHPKENESSLRGTFVSVLILGALIVGSWLGVFYLFMSRS